MHSAFQHDAKMIVDFIHGGKPVVFGMEQNVFPKAPKAAHMNIYL